MAPDRRMRLGYCRGRRQRAGRTKSAAFRRAVRRHWVVENTVRWMPGATFRAYDSRVHDGNGAQYWVRRARLPLNRVGRWTTKASVRVRRQRAVWSGATLLHLLAQ